MSVNKITQILAINILLFISLLLFTPSHAAERKITKTKLGNGLTVILEEDRSAPVAAFQMWVKVGGADELDKEAGIAHVFEHMLFKGTAKRPKAGELAYAVESAGGDINAYTSFDNTVYHLSLPSRNFDTGLDVISDAIQNSAFDKDELKKELEVVLEEIRMNEDSPGRKLYRMLLSTAYSAHPYGRPVIGYESTVKTFTRAQILAFFRKWYVPNNMTLVVSGDFDTNEALKKIKQSFVNFKNAPNPHTEKRKKEPQQKELKVKTVYQPIAETHIAVTFHIPELSHKDTYTLDILQSILGEGVTSRLYKRLKIDSTLVHGMYAYAMTPKDPGLFVINLTLESKNSDAALKAALDEIMRLKTEPVTEREVEKAKRALESSFIYGRETMEGKAEQLGYYETISGDVKYEQKYLDGIRAVSSEDIRRIVNEYFTISNMTAVAVTPESEKELITEATLKNTLLDSPLTKTVETNKKPTTAQGVIKQVLPNGITLLIKEDHSNETVAVYAAFPGGIRHETPGNNGIGNFMASMLTRGTKTRSFETIGREFEDIAGGAGGFSSKNSAGVSGKFLSKYFDKGFELFSDVLMNPVFPDEEIEKVRKDILASIKRDEDYLPGYTFKLLNKDLYGIHPYSMPVKGTYESISKIDRNALIKHYNSVFMPENMIISIVGDIDSKKTIEAVSRYFSAFKGANKPKKPEVKKPALSKTITTGAEKNKEQTNIGIGFLAPGIAEEGSYALTVLAEAIGSQSGRLFVELRDKKSLAYSVSAFYTPGIGTGTFGIYIGCAPQKKDEAVSSIFGELDKLLKEGITKEEIAKAKRAIIGQYEMGLQEVSTQAADMTTNELLGLGYDYSTKYPELLNAVTSEDILLAVKKHITTDKYVISIVGPTAKPD